MAEHAQYAGVAQCQCGNLPAGDPALIQERAQRQHQRRVEVENQAFRLALIYLSPAKSRKLDR